MNKHSVSECAAAISLPAARLSIAGSVVFVVLLVALHFLKPEFHPSWRFINWSLSRNAAWSWQPTGLMWTALLTLICLVAMFGYMGATLPKAGGFGPDVSVGWFNRLLVLSYVVWLVTASWSAIRVRERTA